MSRGQGEVPSRTELRERVADMRDEPERVGTYSLQEITNGLFMTVNSKFTDDHGLEKKDQVEVYRDRELGCLLVFPKEDA